MAKRSENQPNEAEGVQTNAPQSPEVEATLTNPIDTVAATGPSAGAPSPKGKSPVPSPVADFDPDAVTRTRANVLTPIVSISRPALGRFTAMGTELLGDCAIANGLGIREPVKAKVTFSEDYRWCFLMPVHHTATKAIKISYSKGQAHINLWGPFEGRNKIVEKGYRESYDLYMTDDPIKIHDVTGYALYFSMETFEKELQSKRDGEPLAIGESALERSNQASKPSPAPQAASQAANASATSAPEPAKDAGVEQLEVELAEAAESTKLYLDMLDQKDAQIKELKEQLKALQEGLGKG
jgi:hypothetical protein